VYVGGSFGWAGTKPSAMLATLPTPSGQGPPGSRRHGSIALESLAPNPTPDAALVSFTLASDAIVSLSVYDVTGRRVRLLLDQQPLPAGAHEASIQAAGLSPGCYFCRLDALGESTSRKFVVLR